MKKFIFIGFLLLMFLLIFNCPTQESSSGGGKNKSNQPVSGNLLWTRLRGGSDDDIAIGMAKDTSGNMYITGHTESSFDGQMNNGNDDVFLIKFDVSGNHQWTRLRGGSENEFGLDLALDSSGNIYIAGFTNGSFDGQTNNGNYDVFLIKYDANGNHQWTRLRGGTGDDNMYIFEEYIDTCIVIDTDDNVYISGCTDSSTFDSQTNNGSIDAFIIKYDSEGNHQWTRLRGGGAEEISFDMALDANNNIYITGSTNSSFDGQPNYGNGDAFLIKYDPDGNHQWTRLRGGNTGSECIYALAIDSSGNIYITGESNSNTIDGQFNSGSYDALVIKYSADGTPQWTRLRGGNEYDYVRDIAVDTSGNVYISGRTDSTFDGQTNNGDDDVFIVKYNSSGDHLWTHLRGGSSWEIVTTNCMVLDTAGNIYVTGKTRSSTFDGQVSNGESDLFIIKYDVNGSHKWTRVRGSINDEDVYDMALGSNSVYIIGHTENSFDGQSNSGEDDAFICKFYK